MKNIKEKLKGKKITVMGLGLNRGGLGVTKFLAEAGAKVLVTDLKTEKELSSSLKKLEGFPIKYRLGEHKEEDFKSVDLIIQNPGVPNNSRYLLVAKKNKIPIETDMGIFVQLCPSNNIIGIAGTKGKSTTTSLIHHLFKSAGRDVILAGNIGISVFDSLSLINKDTTVILEISSWQLEGLKQHRFAPQIGVLTNVLPDHLDRYRDFKEYSEAEQLIYKYQDKNDFLVLNRDQKITYQAAKKSKAKIFWFSDGKKINQGCFTKDGSIFSKINSVEKEIIKIDEIPILGGHNLSNVLAACIPALIYGILEKQIKKGIKSFKGLPHRLEFIRDIRGVKAYNDSAATTPEACLFALSSFSSPIILILGGKNKKMMFRELVKKISENKNIKKIILLQHPNYDASEDILKEVEKLKIEDSVIISPGMEQAVKVASSLSKKGDIIVLSPAAASFGMFVNEFDRGRQFIKAIKKI